MEKGNFRLDLLDRLASVEDDVVLQKINDLLDGVDIGASRLKLTNSQRDMLKKSEEDIKQNRLIANEEVNKEDDVWLSE